MLGKVPLHTPESSVRRLFPPQSMQRATPQRLPRQTVMSSFNQLLQRNDRVGPVILAALFLGLICFLGTSAPFQAADEAKSAESFELKPGDHICIIGNTLADRMQHDGWLETYI